MGLQSGRLKNHMITASSVWDVNHAAHLARLHNRRRGRYMGAWFARYNTRYQWLQTDFGGAAKIIRISTQGRQDANQWVTQYYVTHSLDRVHFSEYKERNSRKVIRNFISVVFLMTKVFILIPWRLEFVTERQEKLVFELENKVLIGLLSPCVKEINLGVARTLIDPKKYHFKMDKTGFVFIFSSVTSKDTLSIPDLFTWQYPSG